MTQGNWRDTPEPERIYHPYLWMGEEQDAQVRDYREHEAHTKAPVIINVPFSMAGKSGNGTRVIYSTSEWTYGARHSRKQTPQTSPTRWRGVY